MKTAIKGEWYALAVCRKGEGVAVQCQNREEAESEKERLKMSDAVKVAVGHATNDEAFNWLTSRGAKNITLRGPGSFQIS